MRVTWSSKDNIECILGWRQTELMSVWAKYSNAYVVIFVENRGRSFINQYLSNKLRSKTVTDNGYLNIETGEVTEEVIGD